MRKLIARYRRARGAGQEGWALMDAIWSSVVVVMAFMGTFLAIDASTKTATTDVRKSTAYDIAQNELDRLRKMGDVNLPNLLTQDNTVLPPNSPSRTVTVGGVNYSIWNRAYYVQDIGTDITDACGNTAAVAGNTAAQFVYIKTTVTWPGVNGSGPSGASGATTGSSAMLDTYFAPEGGDLQSNTATLRVFLHDRLNNILGSRTVHLYKMPLNTLVATKTTSATGCVLFTGLARSEYHVRIPSSTEYDLYMTSNPVSVPIKVTSRAALSRIIKISAPVTVSPAFVTNAGSGSETVTPGATTNSLVGPWNATAPEIIDTSASEYTTNISFMPHVAAAITNKMFPLVNGYSAYAGACDVNDPGSGNYVVMPAPAGNLTWAPSGTYSGALNLHLPNFRVQLTSATPRAGTGKIQVRLVSRLGGGTTTASCGTRNALFDSWIRLPGTVDTSGFLTNTAYALPAGRYDICVTQRGSGSTWPTKYMLVSGVDNTYPGPSLRQLNVGSLGGISTSACGTGTGDWS